MAAMASFHRSRRKVLSSGACTRSVCQTHMKQRPPVLIHIT